MKRKVLSILVVMAMVISLVAGCGSGDSGKSGEDSKDSGGGDKKTINVFTPYVDSNQEGVANNFRAALKATQEQFPDYEIVHENVGIETYKTKIKALVAADETPDIFFSWGAGFVKSFVEAGKVAAIDDKMSDDAKGKLQAGANDMFMFDDATYGLTSSKWVGALYCNTKIFEENNMELPTTYQELLDACKKFREAGLQPLAIGMKDQWPGQQYPVEFTIQVAGADETNKMVNKETSFDNEKLAEAVDYTIELIEASAFNDGAMGITNEEAYSSFTRGEIPMMFTNSNFSDQAMQDDSAVKDNVTAIRFPTIDGADSAQYFGGAIDGLCMSSSCENPDETYEVLEALAYQWAVADGGLVTWEVPEEAKADVNALNQEIMAFSADATGYALAWDTLLDSADAQEWLDLVSEVYAGNIKTGKDFAKQLQEKIGN